jgi:CRISPR/Cas system Type II protein with McrA/HNH and RuvC-like nuclease domain
MKQSKTPRARQARLVAKRMKRAARDKAKRRAQRIIANPGCRGK